MLHDRTVARAQKQFLTLKDSGIW